MMASVKVAIIGVGGWGRRVVNGLSKLENCELTAICDIDKGKAEEYSRAYGAQGFTDYNSMFEKAEELEAVAIVTPTPSHYDVAASAIKAGKHVFVEKPICDSIVKARKLVEAARKKEVKLMVGHVERFNPALQELKKAITAGKLGRLIFLSARRVGRPVKVSEVGVIKDLAVHDIDAMRFLVGEPRSIFARCGAVEKHPFEDHAEILMIFDEIQGFIEVNWLTLKKERLLTATGNRAFATVDYIEKSLSIKYQDKVETPQFPVDEPLKLELSNFVNSIINNEEPLVTGIDGLRALEVAEAALRSAKTGKLVKLC